MSNVVPSAFVMVIFGITGDLSRHKLIPALLSLYRQRLLPNVFSIIGFSRAEMSDNDIRHHFTALTNEPGWNEFADHIHHQKGRFEDEQGYLSLVDRLTEFDAVNGECAARLFYLATPPSHYEAILAHLDGTGISRGCGQESNKWTRVIVEKPFGNDAETARALDKACSVVFEESQIFRVDHYLGKETVQNMLVFRFANGVFEPAWNKDSIDHVQITWAEKKGVEDRGQFFDGVGLLRDIAQNHLVQLVAAVAMEPPAGFVREAVRDARVSAIRSIRIIEPDQVSRYVVRGQYRGYRSERDVALDSDTETFVAMKLFVDTPRFAGVPFYLRAGKMMPENIVEISVFFAQTCHVLFRDYGCPETQNVLKIRIQPDEGITMRFVAKKPGVRLALTTVDMRFSYREQFQQPVTDAYERILLDIFAGDQTLCGRSDELEHSWELVTRIAEGWARGGAPDLIEYESGSWGPREAFDLVERDGRSWLQHG